MRFFKAKRADRERAQTKIQEQKEVSDLEITCFKQILVSVK